MLHADRVQFLDDGDYWQDKLVEPQRTLAPIHVYDKNHVDPSLAFVILKTPELPLASTLEAKISILRLNKGASSTVVSISPPSPDGLIPNFFSSSTTLPMMSVLSCFTSQVSS